MVVNEIENYLRRVLEQDYEFVRTPQLFRPDMWKRSGHWDHYRENMFEVGDEMLLKPMNCPAHIQIFKNRVVSHRDLPLRYAEFGICHRNEPSGALNGLMRLRQFTQDDGHIFCLRQHIEGEIQKFCAAVREVYGHLGFDKIEAQVSLRPDDRVGSDEEWDAAEQALIAAVEKSGIPFDIVEGDGAFYGPKLEFSLRDSLGRSWQCGTAQLDFFLPHQFELDVMVEEGREVPVIIHRAILGSLERFIGILLEHHGADLPRFLKPVQAVVVPVGRDHEDYAHDVAAKLREQGVRVIVDDYGSVGKRIQRHDSLARDILVVGDREVAEGSVNLRGHGDLTVEDYAQRGAA